MKSEEEIRKRIEEIEQSSCFEQLPERNYLRALRWVLS